MRYMKLKKTVFSYKLWVNWDKAYIDDLGRQIVVDSSKEVWSRLIKSICVNYIRLVFMIITYDDNL